MYLKIGEVAEVDGKKIKCVADDVVTCNNCIYLEDNNTSCTRPPLVDGGVMLLCSPGARAGVSVHFELVSDED